MDQILLSFLIEHIEWIVGGISTIISYFVGGLRERKKEIKNKIDSLLIEIEQIYTEIIGNYEKQPPNILSNRYKILLVENKIKALCKLRKIENTHLIKEHAILSVYATDDQHIDFKKVVRHIENIITILSE